VSTPVFPRREPRWHAETGQDFDLREYRGGKPTGRVANIRTLGDHVQRVPGKHVQLVIDRRQVTVVEHAERKGVLLRAPWRSLVDARLHDEPGIARLRLELTVRVGVSVLPVSLWFDAAWRAELTRLVDHIGRLAQEVAQALPRSTELDDRLQLLDVRCAPPNDEWLAFLPGDCSTEVLRRTAAGPPPAAGPGG
jgi:hypothetical protein